MNVIRPLTIRAAQLDNSTVPYPDSGETAWNSGTTYSIGQTVSYEINGLLQKFESKTNSNSNNPPAAFPNESTHWLDLGAVNRYNMFQLERNTQTIAASPLIVEITPGERFGAVGMGNLLADSVKIEVYEGATQIYESDHDLVGRTVAGWYDYFYQPFRHIPSFFATFDLPVSTTATLKLTFLRESGPVHVGAIVTGMPFKLGDTQHRARVRALNFSEIERDQFGETKLVRRRSVPKTQQTVLIEKKDLDGVMALISELNATVTLWSGLDNPLDGYFGALFIVGLYKDIEYSLDGPRHVIMQIELEAI